MRSAGASARIAAARQLVRWSRSARTMRPVFIVGEMRSGTSILYRVLLRHAAFAPRHFHLTEPKAVHALATHTRLREGPFLNRAFFYGDERRYEELVDGIRAVAPWRVPLVRLARLRPGAVTLFRAALNGVALRGYVAAATEARGCRRLVDKTADNLPYSAHLLASLPQAKLLYIVRHPVDTFGSYRRRHRRDPEARWAALSLDAFTQRWSRNVAAARELARARPESFRIVRYEQFTRDPHTAFAEICAFLDEPYDPSALEVWAGHPPWPTNPRLMEEIAPVTEAWADQVSVAQAAAIEERLRDLMRPLGYEPYTVATPLAT